MKRWIFAGFLLALFLLSACTEAPSLKGEGRTRIVATTYPVYLFATSLTQGIESVEVTLMVSEPTACLHDYTLTVSDMKKLDGARVIITNGAGLEDFMSDVLEQSQAVRIDASDGISLLLSEEHAGHEGHDHEEEYDPHDWMDPGRAAQMVEQIAKGLLNEEGLLSEEEAARLEGNRRGAVDALKTLRGELLEQVNDKLGAASPGLITFHDGFRYFADWLGLNILKSIEEEAGSEASAKEIIEVTGLVERHQIPAIFTEKNGSEATALVVARETGAAVYSLDLIMSGGGKGLQPYEDAMSANLKTVLEALG